MEKRKEIQASKNLKKKKNWLKEVRMAVKLIYNCRGEGLISYIGPWILSEDIDKFEKEQIIIRCSQLKSHK